MAALGAGLVRTGTRGRRGASTRGGGGQAGYWAPGIGCTTLDRSWNHEYHSVATNGGDGCRQWPHLEQVWRGPAHLAGGGPQVVEVVTRRPGYRAPGNGELMLGHSWSHV